jgi:hypothetical protein
MSDRAKKVSELTALTAPAGEDLLYIVDDPSGTPASRKVTVSNLFTNCSSNLTLSNAAVLSANTVVVRRKQTPANSTITVTQGTFFYDSDYLYIATSNNVLKRVSLSAF